MAFVTAYPFINLWKYYPFINLPIHIHTRTLSVTHDGLVDTFSETDVPPIPVLLLWEPKLCLWTIEMQCVTQNGEILLTGDHYIHTSTKSTKFVTASTFNGFFYHPPCHLVILFQSSYGDLSEIFITGFQHLYHMKRSMPSKIKEANRGEELNSKARTQYHIY